MRFQYLTTRLARAAHGTIERFQPNRSLDLDTPHTTLTAHSAAADGASSARNASRIPRPTELTSSREQRISAWRRRVLAKKGARIHAASLERGDGYALAMLDASGMVVAWYDESDDSSRVGVHVVDRHVSQFYVPTDVVSNLPALNLMSAVVCGGSTQQGWRRLPSGGVIWGMTVIEAIVLNDGRLQGFTHVIRPAEGPRADQSIHLPRRSFGRAANARWSMERSSRKPLYVSAAL